MKKLALSLLFSTVFVSTVRPVGYITDLGPIQITTTTGSNQFAAGTVKLNGQIEIGQSSSDTIILEGQDITNGSFTGNSSISTVLAVDSTGQMVSGPLRVLGSASNNNIQCPATTGDLTITALNSGNLVLDAEGNIKVVSTSIANPSAGNLVLAIDTNGNLVSSNSESVFVLGNNNVSSPKSFIKIDNSASTPTGIQISTAGGGAGITLDAGTSYSIIIKGDGITNPSSGNYSLLLIDQNGAVVSGSDSIPVTCGSLTAAGDAGQFIHLGITGTGNAVNFTNNSGNLVIDAKASGANLVMSTGSSITIESADLTAPTGSTNVVLALDSNGAIETSNLGKKFTLGDGSDELTKNAIEVDNATFANGVTVKGSQLVLLGQGLAPAAGYTNVLTIDENGKVGYIVSSAKHKDNISALDINEDCFDTLSPVQYNYKGKKQIEYGFIAEDLVHNEGLKNAVIYNQEGTPMSVNYQAVFVALADSYLKTKKSLNAKIAHLEAQVEAKNKEIADMLELEIQAKNKQIAEIEKRMIELAANYEKIK